MSDTRISRRRAVGLAAVAGVAAAATVAGEAEANQPHMEKALGYLQRAKDELHAAKDNKGGHKPKAMKHINEAIDQVRAGIRATG